MIDSGIKNVLRNITGITAGKFHSSEANLLYKSIKHLFPGLGYIFSIETPLDYLYAAQLVGKMAAEELTGTTFRRRGSNDIEVLADRWDGQPGIYMVVEDHTTFGTLITMFCPDNDFTYYSHGGKWDYDKVKGFHQYK